VLLKHPLTNTGGEDRGQHMLWTRELEMKFRREGPPYPTSSDLIEWAASGDGNTDRIEWAKWVTQTLFGHDGIGIRPLGDHLKSHLEIAELLVNGPDPIIPCRLWDRPSGQEAAKVVSELGQNAQYGGALGASDYISLFHSVLKRSEVRDPVRPHPNIMIWGTLEARVQGADLVILGSLNDGVWPELPAPDPWLNREMRATAGLLVPERRIGLSAHDFQQAIAAKEVILSRSIRNAEAETVPSRWLNRLTNLMNGMSTDGEQRLKEMRARGQVWESLARQLDTPHVSIPLAERPSPRPPVAARPRSLSVTAISRLIRDPFAIYAANILRLKKLDPLHRQPDAPLRGTVLHSVLEQFIRDTDLSAGIDAAKTALLQTTNDVLEEHAPWPAARALWRAKLERVADIFLRDEFNRQARATPVEFEVWGSLFFAGLDFTLKGKADRIDRTDADRFIIYDYKTGSPPTKLQLTHFDKQLLLEAVMIEAGAFENLPAGIVSEVAHIGLGSTPKYDPVSLDIGEVKQIRAEFIELISQYQRQDQGYTSRRAMAEMRFGGDYDHLARFGEWDETRSPNPIEVGE
jgi:double-strand break repair protein AddB